MTNTKDRWVLDYEEKEQELARFLGAKENAVMAFATSQEDRVLVRMVLVVWQDLDAYCFTWGGSRKCDQIRANPRVALCKDAVQLEGQAEIIGGLFDEQNRPHLDMFRRQFPQAIKNWRDRPGMVLIRIRPTAAVLAGAEPGEEPQLQFLNLETKEAHGERWAHT